MACRLAGAKPLSESMLGYSSSSSKFYFQQNTTMEQYQEKENIL